MNDKKIIIRNCPAFVLMRTATSGTYFDMCGNAKGHIECADRTDCVLKQIVEKCRGELGRIRTIGKCDMAYEILQLLEIEECNDGSND